MLASSLLLGTAFAQTLQFKYTFGDGPGTTTTDDPSSAIYPVTLNMVSGAYPGTAVDLHGVVNSGVQNQGSCLDMTANNPSGNSGTQYYAATTANTTLGTGLGTVSNFTATVWFKMSSLVTNNVNNACRFFFLGTNGVTSNGGGNTIDMIINTGVSSVPNFPHNNVQLQLNGTIVPCPVYYDFPTNVWLFVGMTYDAVSGNACVYYGTEASPAKLYTVKTVAGQVFNYGTSATLALGNNLAGNRGFQGKMGEFRFYTGTGDASLIENIRQQSTPLAITGLVPDGSVLQSGTNTLTFTATSANGVNSSGIQVLVNGTDVSSSPYISYTATAGGQIVTYTNLPVNPTMINQSIINGVNVTIKATDAGGIVTSNSYVYDAFSQQNFTWECEDYDFGGGMFIDNPVYTFLGPASDTYYQEVTPYQNTIDANDNGNLSGPSRVYRDPLENVETEYSLGGGNNGGQSISELMRQKVLDAYAATNTARDVNVGYFDGGTGSGLPNWMNYTKTYPSGAYNVYLRVADGAGSTGLAGGPLSDSFDHITSGQGTVSQTLTNLGTFSYLNTGGWDTFAYVPLRDVNGNLVRVSLPGVNTLRLTAGSTGGGNVNFMMLVPANTNLPVVTGIYPNGTNMFQPANALTFTASSPAGVTINPAGISVKLTITSLTGQVTVTNLTTANGLVVTGTATSRNVSAPLATNFIYTAAISVTDVNGSPASSTVSFDTLNPIYTWEAPDYDYNGGVYIPDPIPVDGYLGLSGTAGIDYNFPNVPPGNTYRDSALVGVETDQDSPQRLQFITNSVQPYDMGYYNSGNWLNYTRSFPSGQYNVEVRAADGATGGGSVIIAQVTSGQTTPTQTTTNLGSFTIPSTGGWQTFTWVPLRDGNGNLVKLTGGSVKTLRATSAGSQNVFFYALFPANTNLPAISGIYPNGTTMFQATNKLFFNVQSSVGVNSSSIMVTTNGVAVTGLVFTGSSLNWNVSFPNLLLNTSYTVAISVTDINGNAANANVLFDTFSSSYYTWEGEDFDYNGGQFFDNPQTNAYNGLPAMTDVDTHQVNFNAAAPYLYRTNTLAVLGEGNGMSTEINGDIQRSQYIGTGYTDYSMGYFSGGANTSGSWANYTRHYPAGTYNVYGRLASGGGATTPVLNQVTSGWGTMSQTTNMLGTFNVPNTGWETYTFVPLRDNSGNLVTLTFTGSTNTLQVENPVGTASDVNVNFFMLVPASSGALITITATVSSGTITISFPTQNGSNYQLLYKNSLTDLTWTPIGSPVPGNGAIESINQPVTGTARFYRIQVE
jgi:hypothetical protein